MQPDLELEQIAPELIGTGAQAVVENAKRLGLTWTITLATVTSVDPVEAIVDGDSAAIGMVPMVGPVSIGKRVYVIQVPPSGNFICGTVDGLLYQARETLTASVSSVTFSGIPTNLRSLMVRWRARSDSAATAVAVSMQVNNDVAANYLVQNIQSNAAVTTSALIPAAASAFIGHAAGAMATAGIFGVGTVDFFSLDVTQLSFTWISDSGTIASGGLRHSSTGFYNGISAPYPFTVLTFLAGAGSFITGTDFQLEGVYS